jgi:putative hydrolase of the HAD superfamily
VVFTWDPEAILRRFTPDDEVRERLRSGLMRHADWLALDRGSLEEGAAVARVAERTGLPRQEVARLMAMVPASLVPVRPVVDLLDRVRGTGRRLYCLSNMHRASIEHLERAHAFWDLFDGRVVSCRIGMIKPEPGIYAHLLEAFALDPGETVFIDDMEANLGPAAEMGMRTILFRDPGQCERDLRAAGALERPTGRPG